MLWALGRPPSFGLRLSFGDREEVPDGVLSPLRGVKFRCHRLVYLGGRCLSMPRVSEDGVTLVELVTGAVGEGPGRSPTGCAPMRRKRSVPTRARRADFQTTVLDRWSEAIDRFELVLMLCATTLGASLVRSISGHYANAWDPTARMCNGSPRSTTSWTEPCWLPKRYSYSRRLAAGLVRLARWRTQHELMICAAFVAEGSDELALRLLEHEASGVRGLARSYNIWASHYDEERLDREELQEYDRSAA